MNKLKKHKKLLVVCLGLLMALLALFAGCGIYLGNSYDADLPAIEAFLKDSSVKTEDLGRGSMAFLPEHEPIAGLIFYPGGKVDHEAYIPLMTAFAEQGVLCILVKMPFDLAVFDPNAAKDFEDLYPAVESWYLGGHSLGGAMASSFLSKNANNYKGLLLLGAYSASDLSNTPLRVLSVYGSEDGVLDRQKYEECRKNLPQNTVELVLEGGCHAGFGMYGSQKGDGTPGISQKEQIARTADALFDFLNQNVKEK